MMEGEKIGQYKIGELLGKGAMGEVFRAFDERLERDLAIKFLSTEAAPTAEDKDLFLQEARLAAGLSHPNVVVIHEIGEYEGRPFFVMELLQGNSLRKMIQSGNRPSWREGLEISMQICKALEVAHSGGLLHRDIKPENVWIQPDGLVKILDFGIACLPGGETMTKAGQTMGTPEYMAPEQIMGEPLDGRSDIYAMGVLMYEMFTGLRPFTGPNAVTVIYKQMEEDPVPPGQLAKDLPDEVEKVIMRAMAKERDLRYDSASSFGREIEDLLAGRDATPSTQDVQAVESGSIRRREDGIRFECPVVGREAELNLLRSAVDRMEKGNGGTLLIGGEAGVGKTRLVEEGMAYARRTGGLVLRGSCFYIEGPEPYLPFIEALGQSLETREGADRARVLAFIREEAPELEELAQHMFTVIQTRHSTGITDSDERVAASKERLFEAITQVLLFLSEEAPVVLVLEDLQWADSGTLQLLYYIARNARERRLLIVATFRPEDLVPLEDGETHPLIKTSQQMRQEDVVEEIDLKGMSFEGVNLIARFIFRRALFSSEFRMSLYRETEGNPLFVIELLKLLRDEGILEERKGVWRDLREIERSDIPGRVQDVVHRRLGRLTEDQRELLQIAAISGEHFTSEVISSVGKQERIRILQELGRLERSHQLIRSEKDGYSFALPKIREILYEEIPPELRREYHLAFGYFLETRAEGGGREADIARHLYHGGAMGRAFPYLLRAGDRARRFFGYREAGEFYSMAVEGLLDTEDQNDLKAEVYYKLGAVNYLLGKRTVALEYLAKSETLVSEESNVAGAIQCQFGQILFRSGQYDSATRRFERSMKCYRATGDKKSECSLLVQAALIPFQLGDWKRVRSYYSKSLRIAQEIGDRKQSGTIHMNLGIIASIQGDFDRALELYEKSRKIYEEIEDIGGVGKVWLNTGWSHGERKRWPEARHAYNESLQIARKTRNINEEAKCNTNLAEVMLEERDLKGCKRNCVEALEIFSKINYQVGMADVYKTLGQVSTIERKWPEATAYFDKSISITRTVKHGLGEGKALMELARMRKEQGEFETANQDLDQAITRFEKIESAEDLNTAGQLREEIEALQYLAQE